MSDAIWMIILIVILVNSVVNTYHKQRDKKQRLAKTLSISCRLMELARLETDKGNWELSEELAGLSRQANKGVG